MKFTPTAEDIRVARLLDEELGPIRFIEAIHEENGMTDTTPEQNEDWDDAVPATPNSVAYPEYPYSLADHVYTWSPKLPDGSMLVIRSQTAEGLAEAAEAVSAVAPRLMAAWGNATGRQTAATPPPFGPNVSAPMAPGYQGPPQQTAPQWGAPQQPAFGGAPQGGGFGGNGGQPARNEPKPRPNWPVVYKINVPRDAKETFKSFRAQNAQVLKGKVAWAGGGDYWIHGDVAQGFAQYNPVAA